MRLEGKVAFVTGASRGIGAAVARSLGNEGAAVGLASRSGDDLGLPEAESVSSGSRAFRYFDFLLFFSSVSSFFSSIGSLTGWTKWVVFLSAINLAACASASLLRG